jgi:hypothetical protein
VCQADHARLAFAKRRLSWDYEIGFENFHQGLSAQNTTFRNAPKWATGTYGAFWQSFSEF